MMVGIPMAKAAIGANFKKFHGSFRFRIASGGVRETIKADGVFGRQGI